MVNNMAARGRMKLKVHLDDNGRISEIFVSPTTKCRDIVQRLQRQIRQTNCCLVEVWQGCERLVPEDELIQSTLLEWDTDLEEVAFYLRPNEEILSPHLLDPVTDEIHIIEEDVPHDQVPGSGTLMVTRNGLHENHGISRYNVTGGYSLEDLQQLALRQQQEIEMKERQLAEKEQQLKEIKQRTRHKIRSTYIDQLETQIHEQDMKMRELRQIQDEIEAYRLNNSVLDEELQTMEAQFTIKEQELAIAAAKVEGLTKQLNEQREKWKNANEQNERNMDEIEVDRLRQELMTRNELNHQQSVQMQAQKQLLAEKHKELFELDSQIDQLTQELHKKRAGNVHSTPNTNHRNGTANHETSNLENGLWENGESFDWSEFANTEDTYDEEVRLNYNDKSIGGHRSRQNNSRHLETLVEEEEPSTGSCSKTSSKDGSSNSQGEILSPKQGSKSRVSRLATFFEVAAQNESKDRKGTKKDAMDKELNSVHESPVPGTGSGKHVEILNTREYELTNNSSLRLQTSSDRESDKPADGIFYHRALGSSPLSSPSSLSSLSSFSSTSSASRTTGRHDELRVNPELALRSRETKTSGLDTSSVVTSPYDKSRASYYENRGYGELSINVEGSPSSKQDFSRGEKTLSDSNSPFGNVKTSLQQLRSMAVSLSEPGRTTNRRGFVPESSYEINSPGHASQHVAHDEDVSRSQQTVNFMVKPTGTSFVPQKGNPTEDPVRKTSSPSVAMVFSSPPGRDVLSRDGEDNKTEESNHNQTRSQSRKVTDNNPIRKALYSEEIPSQKSDGTDSSTTSSEAVSKVRITLVSSAKRPTPTTPEISDRKGKGNIEYTDINIPKGKSKSQDRMRTARVIAIGPQEHLTVSTNTNNGHREKESPRSSLSAEQGIGVKTTTSSQSRTTLTDTKNVHSTSLTDEGNHRDVDKGRDSSFSPKETPTSGEKKRIRHVILDPHAVLLDAAVEGELEQVKRVIRDVDDPSLANSDGITALHNAVCGNHDSVVKFLVEYGCDVNLPDSHGWTPLHCSAANNNVNTVKYLVEHGACIFATTGLQKKTPVQCCEKSLPGYQECVNYLKDIQDNFGMASDGKVYALFAYNANEKDELSFECGEELYVLRRGDNNEKEWWWAKNSSGQLGYIPRNLLGISPRVAPEV